MDNLNFGNSITNMKLHWENEDELPEMTDEVYNAMFPTSIVNGVRYFPYLLGIERNKYYLINLGDEKEIE